MAASSRSRWYVVKTNPRCEARAEAGASAAGFRTYLPMASRLMRRRHMKAQQRVYRPLLTGYLFVAVGEGTPGFYDLRQIDGVHSVLGRRLSNESGSANRYVSVADEAVQQIERLEADGKFDEVDYKARPFTRHDQVEITDGPLRGMTFVFDDYFGSRSAKIVAALVENARPMKIDLALLRRAA